MVNPAVNTAVNNVKTAVNGSHATDTATGPPQATGAPHWHATDPEHLVVCGIGGAFLHPTHIFSDAQFGPSTDAVDGPAFVHRGAGVCVCWG